MWKFPKNSDNDLLVSAVDRAGLDDQLKRIGKMYVPYTPVYPNTLDIPVYDKRGDQVGMQSADVVSVQCKYTG